MLTQADTSQQPAHDYVVVRDSGAAKITVHIHTSQILLVQLSSQLGTGYDWTVSRCDSSLVEFKLLSKPESQILQDRGILKPGKSSNMAGSAELRLFQFRPLSPGNTEVEFHSIRPREPEKVDKKLSLSINISR
jgi:hypothetical protein